MPIPIAVTSQGLDTVLESARRARHNTRDKRNKRERTIFRNAHKLVDDFGIEAFILFYHPETEKYYVYNTEAGENWPPSWSFLINRCHPRPEVLTKQSKGNVIPKEQVDISLKYFPQMERQVRQEDLLSGTLVSSEPFPPFNTILRAPPPVASSTPLSVHIGQDRMSAPRSMTLSGTPITALSSGRPFAHDPETCEECQALTQQNLLHDPSTCFQCHGNFTSITSSDQPLRHYTTSLPDSSPIGGKPLGYSLEDNVMDSVQSPTDLCTSPPVLEPFQIPSSLPTTTISLKSSQSPSSEDATTRSADHDAFPYAPTPVIHSQVRRSTRKPVARSSTHRARIELEQILVERRYRTPSKRHSHRLLPLQMTRARKDGRRLQKVTRYSESNAC